MYPRAHRYRLSWKFRAPADPGETRRIERWLATARVFLAISALAAIYMDPTQLGHAPVAYGLLGFYLVHGVMVITLLRRRQIRWSRVFVTARSDLRDETRRQENQQTSREGTHRSQRSGPRRTPLGHACIT